MASSSEDEDEDETPKKLSKRELAAKKKEAPKRGKNGRKKYKSKKYCERPRTIADRRAGDPPLSIKQQMCSMVREKVKALKKPMGVLCSMSTPFARTDAYGKVGQKICALNDATIERSLFLLTMAVY